LLSYKEADKSRINEIKEQKDTEPKWEGVDTKTALKSPAFIIMAVYVFSLTLVVQGLLESFTARLTDKGISVGFAATVLSVFSVMFAFSKFFTGFLYDKFGIVLTACVCNFSAVLAVLLFVSTNNSPFGRVLAILSAIVFAFSVPIETVLLSLFANDFFGFRAYNDVLGIFVSVMYAGAGVGPLLLNASFDIAGNYNAGYLISFVISVACCILFFVAYGSSKKLKNTQMKGK
jgi:MFS family permease